MLYYCLTFKQESQRIICTINFLCLSNLHNTCTGIDRQSSQNMFTYFVSVTANQNAVYAKIQLLRCENDVTNRKNTLSQTVYTCIFNASLKFFVFIYM